MAQCKSKDKTSTGNQPIEISSHYGIEYHTLTVSRKNTFDQNIIITEEIEEHIQKPLKCQYF